jgi:integrase
MGAGDDWANWQGAGLVFTTRHGRPLEGARITRDFTAILMRANLPHQRFHDLRHACATFMLAQGVPLRVVSEWLGHSQIGLTADTYGHVLSAAKQEAANRMQALLA